MGFIYQIDLKDGGFYIGRKQFWKKVKGKYIENDWKDYGSSSKTIKKDPSQITGRAILAVFSSKSTIRFAEASAILLSGSYYPSTKGVNWSFDGCRGKLKMQGTDEEQMNRLLKRWK